MSGYRIPFNKPGLVGKELEYITAAVRDGHASGDGVYTKKCHALLEQALGVPKVLLTTSCTHALEMAALLLDVQPGDEVIVPAFTFVSTINAFVLRGARPVFIDIRPDTLNLDERLIARHLSSHTKAIVAMHYGGVACEMDTISELARQHGITVVEDNAHGLFATYHGRPLGTLSALATQSFHETKNFACGEGGALLINDGRYIERAEVIRQKGTNRNRFFRGEVDKYTWVDIGSSYLPSDLLAAVLYAQLEARDTIQSRRRRVWEYYWQHLQDWAHATGAQLPSIPAYCEQPYHLFYVLMPGLAQRRALIEHLKSRGILGVFHYQPLHLSEMGRRFGGAPGDCPVTEDVSDRLLRLPFYNDLTEDEQAEVIEAIRQFRPKA